MKDRQQAAYELHHRLVEGLETAIARIRTIMELGRRLLAGIDDEFTTLQYGVQQLVLGYDAVGIGNEILQDGERLRSQGDVVPMFVLQRPGVEIELDTVYDKF